MKRISLGLAAAGLTASLGAYAALPTDAAPFQVNIPNLKDGLMFTVEGLLLQPTNSDLDYATTVNLTNATNPTYDQNAVDPGYEFGFRVGIGYVFPQSGNDVQLNWTHLTAKQTDTTTITNYSDAVVFVNNPSNLGFSTVNGQQFNQGSGSTDFKYDAVDLDVGQYVNFGTRLQMRMFGGLRYAHIEDDYSQNYINNSGVTGTNSAFDWLNVENNSKFDGVGPRFGIDSSYHLGHCFGLVGHVAAAALVGTVKTYTNITQAQTLVTTAPGSVTTNLNADNVTRVVPGVDAKLGLDYSYPFGQNQDYEFRIELGWQVTHYVDAIDRLEFDSLTQPVTGGLNGGQVSEVERETSSVGFQGPYLTLNLKV